MDDAIEFFRRFSETDYQVRHAMYSALDNFWFVTQSYALDEMFEETLRPGLIRRIDHGKRCTLPEYIEAAARQQRRPIFAVARYQHADIQLYRAWMGAPERNPRGDGITESFYVIRGHERFTIHSVYRVCSACLGADDGRRCPTCLGAPWRCQGGTQWFSDHVPRELRMLGRPSDPRYQGAYEAILSLRRSARRQRGWFAWFGGALQDVVEAVRSALARILRGRSQGRSR